MRTFKVKSWSGFSGSGGLGSGWSSGRALLARARGQSRGCARVAGRLVRISLISPAVPAGVAQWAIPAPLTWRPDPRWGSGRVPGYSSMPQIICKLSPHTELLDLLSR